MIGLHKQPSFSWKHGFFTSQSEGLYNYNALTKDKAQKNIEIKCPSVTKHKNQFQWNFPMAVAVPKPNDSAMGIDPVSPVPLHVSPASPATEPND